MGLKKKKNNKNSQCQKATPRFDSSSVRIKLEMRTKKKKKIKIEARTHTAKKIIRTAKKNTKKNQ